MPKTILIRADASPEIGAGHVMRCLALAQAWQDSGGNTVFAMAMRSPGLEQRLQEEGIDILYLSHKAGSVEDAIETIQHAQEKDVSWVIVDGYHFDSQYQKIIKNAGLKLLCIDDTGHAEHYYADIVLNQNIRAGYDLYLNREPYTYLLLGNRYVLLRKEFLRWREWKKEIPLIAKKVLITLGGSDRQNLTLAVLKALPYVKTAGLEPLVIVYGNNLNYAELQSAAHALPLPIKIKRDVTNVAELMAWADIAVSAGGSTCWELAFMGLPHIMLCVAENQKENVKAIATIGFGINLGWFEQVTTMQIADELNRLCNDQSQLLFMSHTGRLFIDAEGSQRVLSAMIHYQSPMTEDAHIEIRLATVTDLIEIWRLANDPLVRSQSFSHNHIPLDHHLEWYRHRLSSPESCTFIAEANGVHAGQIRYDCTDSDDIELHFSVSSQFRGHGVGTKLLGQTWENACKKLNAHQVRGRVLQNNTPSVRTFLKAGFKKTAETTYQGHPCYVFEQCC